MRRFDGSPDTPSIDAVPDVVYSVSIQSHLDLVFDLRDRLYHGLFLDRVLRLDLVLCQIFHHDHSDDVVMLNPKFPFLDSYKSSYLRRLSFEFGFAFFSN